MTRTLTIDGKKITYFQSPENDKPVLLVLPGWSTNYDNWYQIADQLEKDFQVISPNLPGFWGSEELGREHSIKAFAEFLEKFVDVVGMKNFFILAESLGASVGIEYLVANQDRVKKACLVGLKYNHSPQLNFVGKLMKWGAKHKFGTTVADWLRQSDQVQKIWGQEFVQSSTLPKDYFERQKMKAFASKSNVWLEAGGDAVLTNTWPLLWKVSVPILLAYGTEDGLAPHMPIQQLNLPASVTIKYFFGKHSPNKEHPEEFAQTLVSFMLH